MIGVIDLWSVVAYLHRASVAAGFAVYPATSSLAAAHHADHEVAIAAVVDLLALVVVGILFLCWLHRLVSELHRLRPGVQRSSPGWAVGAWFVPFINLVVPKQVVNDMWRASTPAGPRESRPPTLLSLWWAGWLIQGAVAAVAVSMLHPDTPSAVMHHDRVDALGHGIDLVVALLAIVVVHTLTARVDQIPATSDHWAGIGITTHFQVPPGWPLPPTGWTPPPGWAPDPSWPPAPAGWRFWTPTPVLRTAPIGWEAASSEWQYWAN